MLEFGRELAIFIGEIETGRGDWIDLPVYDGEELHEMLVEIGVREGKEWMIYDFDNYTGMNLNDLMEGHYPSFTLINDFMLYINDLDDHELHDLGILSLEYGIDDAMEILERNDYYIIEFDYLSDVTNQLLSDMYNTEMIEGLINYIDDYKFINDHTESLNERDQYVVVYAY